MSVAPSPREGSCADALVVASSAIASYQHCSLHLRCVGGWQALEGSKGVNVDAQTAGWIAGL